MPRVFSRCHGRDKRFWARISDIEPFKREDWEEQFKRTGLLPEESVLPERLFSAGTASQDLSVSPLACALQLQIAGLQGEIPGVHIYMLADCDGRLLDIHSDSDTTRMLKLLGMVPGVSFAMESIGVNAISVAMETGRTTVVDGSEHHLRVFDDWTCVCAPVHKGKAVAGYLDLSFASGTDVTYAALLLERIVRLLEDSLLEDSEFVKDRVLERFHVHGLTPREKDVGYRWLQNETTAYIAAELGICEGTVRNMLKSVYAKTDVSGKGEFMHKFLV